MFNKLTGFCFFCLLLVFNVQAKPVYEHAHLASPEHYSVLLENEQVLVLKMVLKPGESDRFHKHNAETVYFQQGGRAVIKTEKASLNIDIPDGHTMWHDQWVHQVSNVGDTEIIAIIVESKQTN